jgi:hypothetical protein
LPAVDRILALPASRDVRDIHDDPIGGFDRDVLDVERVRTYRIARSRQATPFGPVPCADRRSCDHVGHAW